MDDILATISGVTREEKRKYAASPEITGLNQKFFGALITGIVILILMLVAHSEKWFGEYEQITIAGAAIGGLLVIIAMGIQFYTDRILWPALILEKKKQEGDAILAIGRRLAEENSKKTE